VSAQSRYDEERLAELLGLLPPAPEGWVRAAQELPAARARLDELGLDDIVERAREDAAYRAAVVADLEAALAAAGHEPTRALVHVLRACLADLDR
jgi:hypothetical protein